MKGGQALRYDILGVAFDHLTPDEAIVHACAFLEEDRPHAVVTPNAEIVWLAARNRALLEALDAADLVLPDSIGIVKAARILGHPIQERLPGIDFAQALLPALARRGTPVFLFGGRPGVSQEAARKLTETHAGLNICGTRDGYYPPGTEGDIAEIIRQSGAQVVFVCLGAPKQELFIQTYGAQTGARLLIGLGGALDVWAGLVRRAPKVFIKLGLEWLYRFLRHPSRLNRAYRLPAFLWAVRRAKRKSLR